MDMGEVVRIAGIGCRKGVSAREVLAAVEAALAAVPEGRGEGDDFRTIDMLAAAAFKAGELGIRAAAKTLGMPIVFVSRAELERASPRCLTRSAASFAATGTGSAAEAAALAAAGGSGTLIGPRIIRANVTCAIAQGGREA